MPERIVIVFDAKLDSRSQASFMGDGSARLVRARYTGEVFGHPELEDGTEILTDVIEGSPSGLCEIVTSKNGTRYYLIP